MSDKTIKIGDVQVLLKPGASLSPIYTTPAPGGVQLLSCVEIYYAGHVVAEIVIPPKEAKDERARTT